MFKVYYEFNTIYAIFQDLSDESRKDISKQISQKLRHENIPISIHKRIKDFFIDNKVIESNFNRQKAYISTLKTYIDFVSDTQKKNTYRLNLYVLPKDVNITYNKCYNDQTIISKVENLSFHIFKLYDSLQAKSDEKLKLLKTSKGETFLDLELEFYLQELNNLYNHLLTYKRNLKDKIICSDKDVGIMIDDLNELENNPLKRYQFVKVPNQRDLIIFVYSLIAFLENERINYFKENPSYKKLKNIISRISNYLLKISTSTHIKKERISFKSLPSFFSRYKNSKEIQSNLSIYNILESIFYNQLKEGVFISKSIDMTKMFEQVVENSLKKKYKDDLFIGDEQQGKIIGNNADDVKHLEEINYLLQDDCINGEKVKEEKVKKRIHQFPDFLIKSSDIYHMVDAKYKLKNYLFKDRSIFWQILIYSKLFNKDIDQNLVKKVIVFAKESEINLDSIDQISINENAIDINDIKSFDSRYDEMVYDSKIDFIGVEILS